MDKLITDLFEKNEMSTARFLGDEGEIRICGYLNEHYLEFTIELETFTFVYERNDEEIICIETPLFDQIEFIINSTISNYF